MPVPCCAELLQPQQKSLPGQQLPWLHPLQDDCLKDVAAAVNLEAVIATKDEVAFVDVALMEQMGSRLPLVSQEL